MFRVGSEMKTLKQEEMRVLLLDTRNHVRKVITVGKGTLDTSIVHSRDVFREAIAEGLRMHGTAAGKCKEHNACT